MIIYFNTAEEISTLGSYLEFGYHNLVNFKQRLKSEMEDDVKEIRQSGFFPPELSNEEISQRISLMDFDDGFFLTEEGKPFSRIYNNLYGKEFSIKYDEMFYASAIIMLYSRIEIGFVKLCDIKRTKKDSGKCILDDAHDYLIGTLGCEINESDWQEIENIRRVRNKLIHSGLSFPFEDFVDDEVALNSYGDNALVEISPALLKYLKSKNIYSKEYGAISLNLEYCRQAIEFSSNFFQGISGAYWRKLGES